MSQIESNCSSKIKEFYELHDEMEEQFLDYEAMSQYDIPWNTWKAAEIGNEKLYRIDVIWGYLRAKLSPLSDIALCDLVVPHSNAWGERISSMTRKNKTDFWSRLQLDGSLN